jgi:hypothetical protein
MPSVTYKYIGLYIGQVTTKLSQDFTNMALKLNVNLSHMAPRPIQVFY